GDFGPDFAARVLGNVVSEEENVKAVVAKVQLGEADAGIVYVSDVTRAVRRAVRNIPIPDAYNVIADYPIAVVAGARHGGDARAFVNFMLSAEGQRLLERHGLLAARP
ncbi:MAG: extracellular solute-binding protein, partial [Deltaproteobacteria bacterium]